MEKIKVPILVKIISVIFVLASFASLLALGMVLNSLELLFDGGIFRAIISVLVFILLLVATLAIGRSLYLGKNWSRISIIVLGVFSTANSIDSLIKGREFSNMAIFWVSFFLILFITLYLSLNSKVKKVFKN